MGRIVRPAMACSYVFHFSLMKNLYAKHCKICNVAVMSSISIWWNFLGYVCLLFYCGWTVGEFWQLCTRYFLGSDGQRGTQYIYSFWWLMRGLIGCWVLFIVEMIYSSLSSSLYVDALLKVQAHVYIRFLCYWYFVHN